MNSLLDLYHQLIQLKESNGEKIKIFLTDAKARSKYQEPENRYKAVNQLDQSFSRAPQEYQILQW